MKLDKAETKITLTWTPLEQTENRSLGCTFECPPAWSATPATSSRIVLFPDDLDDFKGDRFAPNVVLDVSPEAPSGDLERPAPVVVSALPDNAADSHGQSGVFVSASDGRVVVQLTKEHAIDGGYLSVACSALESQWLAVSGAFDQLIDSLEVNASMPEGSS